MYNGNNYNRNIMVDNYNNQYGIPRQQYRNAFYQDFNAIQGKIINDPNEITPEDVPMNGSISYFPKKDGSMIIAKAWNRNGGIDTCIYVPLETENKNETNDQYENICSRLDKIEKMLNNRKPYYKKPYNKNREENNNEHQ